MPRPAGSRNADHADARAKLLSKLRARLTVTGAERLSFRELAEVAGVSVPTLRHYFGSRTSLVEVVLRDIGDAGRLYIEAASIAAATLEESLEEAASMIVAGVRHGGMDRVHTLGLTEGLGDPKLGPAYLSAILEPALQAVEARLKTHQERGEMAEVSTRHAALAFVAPILLALLHQNRLGGDGVRPMDVPAFLRDQVALFLKAYATDPKT